MYDQINLAWALSVDDAHLGIRLRANKSEAHTTGSVYITLTYSS